MLERLLTLAVELRLGRSRADVLEVDLGRVDAPRVIEEVLEELVGVLLLNDRLGCADDVFGPRLASPPR